VEGKSNPPRPNLFSRGKGGERGRLLPVFDGIKEEKKNVAKSPIFLEGLARWEEGYLTSRGEKRALERKELPLASKDARAARPDERGGGYRHS